MPDGRRNSDIRRIASYRALHSAAEPQRIPKRSNAENAEKTPHLARLDNLAQ
jgi:hypothetical protein